MGSTLSDFPHVEIKSRADLRSWLSAHHQQAQSVWLVVFNNRGPDRAVAVFHVPYGDIVEEALCFGWIDSRPAKLDETRSLLLLSPRRPGSAWSKVNKDRAEHLMASGLMTRAGQEKIDRAKLDGTWSALDEVDALTVPADLRVALAALADAERYFDAFSRSSRRGILEWISAAKTPETRARRIARTAELAARDVKANHPAGRAAGRAQ